MKDSDINLTKYVQNLYAENYKTLIKKKKTEDLKKNGETYSVHRPKDSVLIHLSSPN